jgi:acetyl-CoA carboxylase, biotin carboxylase subunit
MMRSRSNPPFRRVLIANRGEIAVRAIRACETLGIETVAAVSQADRESLAARTATRAVCIGPAPAAGSYLKPELLITAAQGTGCEAVYPGYGFLSERPGFARLCAEHGLVFVGPSAEAIESMGDKITAIRLAEEAGVPRVPGSGEVRDTADARDFAHRHGFPLLVKASAGGGGRGMRVVRREGELAGALEAAAREAKAAFGDPTLYVEKYIEQARHIEIQLLGDDTGSIVHLGERDCSTQRRHQKLIEEAPSPAIGPELRAALADAAIRLARRVEYRGAGTVEFIYDARTGEYFFLEMNTRIQVEHPVTEMITGCDLVVEQLRIAAGEPISFSQDDVRLQGHAIECRINAEDFTRGFMPGPGRIEAWRSPDGPGLRVDTHCFSGYQVPPYYDSLLAKLIAHGDDRDHAIDRMAGALDEFEVTGLPTTIPFHRRVLANQDFRRARITTRWVEESFLPSMTTDDAGPRARPAGPAREAGR